jgi:hypothetical protein
VKFILEVNLDGFGEEAGKELGRILRYWGGAAPQLDLTREATQAVYDSAYREVGRWRITASAD